MTDELIEINCNHLRKLQLLELKILLEFRRICDKYHLNYYLIGGTLLGAARHGGFIPWDDDIDVGMMRLDYQRFVDICNTELSKEFTFQTYNSEIGYGASYGKLRLKGTTFFETATENNPISPGIFIDIFPFDYVSNNKYLEIIQKYLFYEFDSLCCHKCQYHMLSETRLHKLFNLTNYIISKLLPRDIIFKFREIIMTMYDNDHPTEYVKNFPFYAHNVTIFENLQEVEFEGFKFTAPAGDAYLRTCYGDYMKLPPENQRTRHSPYVPDFGKYADVKTVDDILKEYK